MSGHEANRSARLLFALAVVAGAAGAWHAAGVARAATPFLASHAGARPLDDAGDKKDAKKDDAPPGDPVDVDKLPKAVVNGLKKAMPGARIVKALKMTDGNYFLDDVKVGKKEYDVTISPEGKVLKSVEQQEN